MLAVRPDGVPWAAQEVRYVPHDDAYLWRDCLGRWQQRPVAWFGQQAASAGTIAAILEARVRLWWRPAR